MEKESIVQKLHVLIVITQLFFRKGQKPGDKKSILIILGLYETVYIQYDC